MILAPQLIKELKMPEILLTKEAAKFLRVSEEYVRQLIRDGKIKAYKEGRRGGYRIRREAIEMYVSRKHGERN